MKCKKCKTKLSKGVKCCEVCGTEVKKKKPLIKRPGCFIPLIIFVLLIVAAGVVLVWAELEGGSSKNTHKNNHRISEFSGIQHRATRTTEPTEAEPEPTDDPDITPDPEVSDGDYRTIMIYMIGSNLESNSGLGTSDISEMIDADLEEGTNVIIQTGGALNWVNPMIDDGEVNRFEISDGSLNKLDDLGELSMVEKSTLVDFIEYSAENYPAQNYTLVMYNHGGGVPISFGYDEIYEGSLTDVMLGEALSEAGVHFDALIFNACDMCSLELLMSVKDSTDYVVASERTLYGYDLYGAGIDYASWLPLASDPDVDIETVCDTIADDYIDFLYEINCPGSMSIIKSSEVQNVYDIYCSYIGDIYDNFGPETYVAYMSARKDSVTYEGTDGVDLFTLSEYFSNVYTPSVQNAVDSAVVRVASTLENDRGITVYSIYDHFEYYNEGRESLVSLGYDDKIINFYDLIASRIFFYAGLEAFAGDWYTQPDDVNDYGQDLTLPSEGSDGNYTIPISDIYYTISNVEMWFIFDTDNPRTRYVYGTDRQCSVNSNYDISVEAPEYWLHVNGVIPTTILADRIYDQDGNFFQVNLVYALVNGEEALLRLECGTDNLPGTFVGYYSTDFLNLNISGTLQPLNDDDEIQLVVTAISSGGNMGYPPYDEVIMASDLAPEWSEVDVDETQGEIVLYYVISDIYGNQYTTDFFHLG